MSAVKKIIEEIKRETEGEVGEASPAYLALIKVFPLQAVTSKSQHKVALRVLSRLVEFSQNEPHLDEGIAAYMRMLAELIERFELSRAKATHVSGADMLRYLMDLHDLTQADLSQDLGGQSVVSDILRGKRELNLKQVRVLAKRFKISPEAFI